MALYTATIILCLFFPPKPVDSSKLTARLYGMCGAVRVCVCVCALVVLEYLSVFTVSIDEEAAGEMFAIMTVRPLPTNDSLSTCVSLLERKGVYEELHQ